jgi:membrane protease subunit HflC
MTAYTNALTGNGTTLVLSPDSTFFRYFNNINGTQPQGAAPAAPPAPATSPTQAPAN